MARIYPDSKTFVDKKLKFPPNKIIKNFETLLKEQQDGSLLSVDQIKQFVQDHFDEEGMELEPWVPGTYYGLLRVCKIGTTCPHFTKGATFKKVILIATTYYPSENGFTSSTDKNSLVTFCAFVNLIFAYLFSHHSHLLLLCEPETIKRFHFFLLFFFSDDWTPEPEFIATLRKPALRNLAKRIARLWRDLSRKIKEDVKDNSSLYSIIYVPNGFVVPGGECLRTPL